MLRHVALVLGLCFERKIYVQGALVATFVVMLRSRNTGFGDLCVSYPKETAALEVSTT